MLSSSSCASRARPAAGKLSACFSTCSKSMA
jgi:hypothetical protein